MFNFSLVGQDGTFIKFLKTKSIVAADVNWLYRKNGDQVLIT